MPRLLSRGETSGFDCSLSMHLERIKAHVPLLHLLSNRCVGGEMCLSSKHHLSWDSRHTSAIFHSSWGQPRRWPTTKVLNFSNECPKRKALSALVLKNEKTEEDARLGSMQMIGAL